jgi:arabinose-5-phosphate isomerase
MRVGERNPVISQDATVQEGLLQMTRAKAGSLGIVDGKGKLAGIFTDGDLRRHMAADTQLLSRKLSEVMTRNPVTVKEDELMANAINIFNSRNIDDLLVVNAKREPVGLVDSQDLPKMKLM